MAMRYIDRIKKMLPKAVHAVMFYTNGTVFHVTPEKSAVNVPKLGEAMAEIIEKFKTLKSIYELDKEPFRKIIYETMNFLIAIIKLGEDSNLALLLENVEAQELKIGPIKHYLEKLEKLIDMSQSELEGPVNDDLEL